MELVYLWVEDYKNIQHQGFNFSPRFTCKYDEKGNELTINENKEYISIFPENINVTAIVGENGSGKSNLLDFIIQQDEYSGIYVLYQESEFFIFNKKQNHKDLNIKMTYRYSLNPTYLPEKRSSSLIFLKSYMDINTYSMSEQLIPRKFFQFSEKRDILSDLHKNTTELFNIISINSKKNIHDSFETNPYTILALNHHFSYLKDKYLHKILKYYSRLEDFLHIYFNIDKIDYHIKDLGDIFKASPKFKDNYKSDNFLNTIFDLYYKNQDINQKLKLLALIFAYIDEEDIRKIILDKQENMNYFALYDDISQLNNEYINKWDNFRHLIQENNIKEIIKKSLIFSKEIRHEILEFSFTPQLSSGEEKLLYLFVNIYDYILDYERIGLNNFTILLDEPDTLLHPNWQKKIIFLFITFFNTFFKNYTFNLIITSHSPFILSDLPKENVIFLEQGEQVNVDIETFGANIHTLLSHGFFMKNGLMGEFAKGKINETIKFLNKEQSEIKNEKEAKNIIDKIGEPFLQEKLLTLYETSYPPSNEEKIQSLKKQIKELENANA